jgi:hypothetical protein
MNKTLKTTLIVVGSLALAGGITYAIYRVAKKRKEDKEQKEREQQQEAELQIINEGVSGQQESTSEMVTPIRNLDKNINNSYAEIRGVELFPAQKSSNPILGHEFAQGYAILRNTPEVNTKQAWWDFKDNEVGRVSTGSSIGTIRGEKYDNLTPAMRWFWVKLTKKIGSREHAWVRADVVTFKPFKRKTSSFDGSKFVEKYDNSYQLGAQVFPHSNWMIGYPTYGNDVSSDFEGKLDLDL